MTRVQVCGSITGFDIAVQRLITFAAVSCFSLLLTPGASAQWIDYKTPGLPRTPDGKVNLKASRPMTTDGKPDLTGLWALEPRIDVAGALAAAGPQPWIVDAANTYMHELGRNDTGVLCLPAGPRDTVGVPFAKFIQTPALITVLYEGLEYRQIFTDGRPLPADMNPTWLGYSIGRWEGDTLVVTTTGYNDRTFLDGFGHRHTEALRVTERFTRRDLGHMDIVVTVEDPRAYATPITIPVEASLRPDTEMIEYVCNENERSRPHLIGTAADDRKLRVAVEPAALKSYEGAYEFPPLVPGTKVFVVTVTAKDGDLLLSIERGPTLTAIPTSRTKFLAQGVGVEFLPGPGGVVNEMVVTIVEGELKGVRIK